MPNLRSLAAAADAVAERAVRRLDTVYVDGWV